MDYCPCDIERKKHRVPLRKSFDLLVYLSTKFIISYAEALNLVSDEEAATIQRALVPVFDPQNDKDMLQIFLDDFFEVEREDGSVELRDKVTQAQFKAELISAGNFSIFDAPVFRKQLLDLFCSEIDPILLEKDNRRAINVYYNDQKGNAVKTIQARVAELTQQSDYEFRKTQVNGVTIYVPYPKDKEEKIENYLYRGGEKVEHLFAERVKRGKKPLP